MSATAAILQEFEQECKTTRRLLERVPTDKLAWKPHAKSMSLGTLAMHVASSPGYITGWATQDSVEFAGEASPEPKSADEVLAAHDDSVAKTKANLSQIGDTGMGHMWAMKSPDGKTVMTMPKVMFLRAIMLNHWIQHRGQLGVYLRLTGAKVPSSYGPSGDEG